MQEEITIYPNYSMPLSKATYKKIYAGTILYVYVIPAGIEATTLVWLAPCIHHVSHRGPPLLVIWQQQQQKSDIVSVVQTSTDSSLGS